MNLLIVAPNWLGDAVMALPAIADVERASPGATITVAAKPSIAPLFTLGAGSLLRISPPSSPDAVLLLPNSFRSALAAYRAGVPERWGYRTEWRGPLLTRAIDRAPKGVHQVEYYQRLVHALGFPNGPGEPKVAISSDTREAGANLLEKAGWNRSMPVVALAPGAAYGGAKRWPPKYWAELAIALALDDVATAMVGTMADVRTGAEIESHMGGRARIINVIGKTDLRALAGVLVSCRSLVTNDSGAMHLAAAVGVPVTAVFGPTDELVTGPRGEGHAILTHSVWCRPCLLRECPIDHRCMRGVAVDVVLREARRSL